MQKLRTLLILARQALYSPFLFTTSSIAKQVGKSQQTISNWLFELEDRGLVSRNPKNRGVEICLTKKGRKLLQDYYNELGELLAPAASIEGTVSTGLGQGRFYTEIPAYNRQFVQKLGIRPHPGTLNLKVDRGQKEQFIAGRRAVAINGFSTSRRTYGDILAYPVEVGGHKCALVIPKRSIHRDVMEIISRRDLRRALNLKDNDRVVVKWRTKG